MFLSLSVPPNGDRGPQYMEQALAAIHQANARCLPLELVYVHDGTTVGLSVRAPADLAAVVVPQLAAHYPAATITRFSEDILTPPAGFSTWSASLRLRPDIFPVRRYAQFDDPLQRSSSDPLTALFAALPPVGRSSASVSLTLTTIPARPRIVRRARRTLRRLAMPFFRRHPRLARLYALGATSASLPVRFLTRTIGMLCPALHESPMLTPPSSSPRTHEREDDLAAAVDKLGRHLYEVRIILRVSAPPDAASSARSHLRRIAGAFGQFTVPRMAAFRLSAVRSRPVAAAPFLLSCEELATLWHPATSTVRAPAMQVTESRELEPPVLLPLVATEPDATPLGRLHFRLRRSIFGIRIDDRRRHIAVIGKTGMGKTTLLKKLIDGDIRARRGLAVIDPHGDLANAVMDAIPTDRTNDVILFDAGDRDYPLAYNPLACAGPHERPLVASAVVSAFKKLYGDSWGPRLEHILRCSLLALLETPGTSLLSLQRLLSDTVYRKGITARLHDPVVRAFWEHEYASWRPQYQAEAIAPIQNKVGQFLSQPILRAIVGQGRSALDLRRVMDEGQILIVNLSKGRIGEDASTLLGSLLVTGIQLAAMSRADVPEHDRRDFALHVDEFQNFATESFATILSEARKYRLSLVLATQYLAQMEEPTLNAVFGNVGSLLVFAVGANDAEVLAEQLGGDATPRDLMALPRYRAYARLLIDGMPSRPFSFETLAPPRIDERQRRADVVRRVSRHRYTRPLSRVEEDIRHSFSHVV